MAKVTVIGCGAWAVTIAKILAENDHQVVIWCHREMLSDDININHMQSKALSGILLPPNLNATTDLKKAIMHGKYIVFGLASSFLSVVDEMKPYYPENKFMLSLTKGILKNQDELFVSSFLKRKLKCPLAILSGPNIALEVAHKLPAATVIASTDHKVSKKFQKLLSNSRFRVYTSKDPIGVEIGGMLKNIIAIAAGCIDGLKLGNNAKATLISRGIKEMIRFG
jgi:glycerol-3-phosphate dehydrogenase (NAD(P)+)